MLKEVTALNLTLEGFPETPAMDVAVSHAILRAVARGDIGPIFRLHVPTRIVAFGRGDRSRSGYPRAVRSAQAHGFAPVERLAGGRAAVFHRRTLAFSWAVAEPDPRGGITDRFRTISGLMAEAFRSLGLDARIGEVPGEYCPGAWSVNLGGRVKVMGVGQRVVRGAAHVGGVVVVDEARQIRDVLVPVYRSLVFDWDPRTTGALADRSPGLDTTNVTTAIVTSLSARFDVEQGKLPPQVIRDAGSLLSEHLPRVA